ncbi:acyltransferase [Fundidesulfovibrio soli]|uniref:acyltransferase n=1 Tax=Fundidesulfovibrio soli TaxID=2922716 RepID=UPI001FAFA262|nr:acyltransferase [Fundidesulfovibrio soli]
MGLTAAEVRRAARSLLPDSFHDLFLDVISYVSNHVVCHVPSHWFRLWFYRNIMRWAIGKDTSLHERLRIHGVPGPGVSIGDNTCIGADLFLAGVGYPGGGLTIGNNVNIAMQVFIGVGGHKIGCAEGFAMQMRPVVIEDHAVIYARSMVIMCRIGRGAVVLPGAVVVKDVEPFTIVGGVPAEPLGKREPQEDPNYLLNWRWRFH